MVTRLGGSPRGDRPYWGRTGLRASPSVPSTAPQQGFEQLPDYRSFSNCFPTWRGWWVVSRGHISFRVIDLVRSKATYSGFVILGGAR